MAQVLTDERVAAILRPFVRAAGPVLRALRQSDPLRLRQRLGVAGEPAQDDELAPQRGRMRKLTEQLDSMQLPGSSTWDAMTVQQRCDWWVKRVGRVLALVASLPRFGGAVTSRLPIRNALGTAGQGLVLVAIAGEYGIEDRGEQVRLIANVVLDRELSQELAVGPTDTAREQDDEVASELTEDLDGGDGRRAAPKAVAASVWRMARWLWEIDSELDKRPQGNPAHEAIGNLPIVGVVGGYLGERAGLRRVAKDGAAWLRREGPAIG